MGFLHVRNVVPGITTDTNGRFYFRLQLPLATDDEPLDGSVAYGGAILQP